MLWPLIVYFAAVLLIAGGMLLISYLLGPRHEGLDRGTPYESGIALTGTSHVRFDVKFYLNAMFFVIFDLEAAFIIAWAVAVREIGWTGYFAVLIFVGVMLAGLVYEWRLGALDWTPSRRSR
jgi:NADH-quinone oxidoreductase subunit A